MRLQAFDIDDALCRGLATSADGFSYADIAGACDGALRSMILDGRFRLSPKDLSHALEARAEGATRELISILPETVFGVRFETDGVTLPCDCGRRREQLGECGVGDGRWGPGSFSQRR